MFEHEIELYLFLPLSFCKVHLAAWSQCVLKDSAGVDANIFDELMRTSKVSFKILDGDKSGKN